VSSWVAPTWSGNITGRAGRTTALVPTGGAEGGKPVGPNEIVSEQFVYYPATEVLAENEVRVIACGTGMPDQRKAQASACFLFEFGNGEKLIFDLGTGSMRNIASLMIPYEYLDKIFVSHLHTDHWGELGALWAGGWTSGRPGPLQIWGPSGQTLEMGTAYAVDHFLKANNWDYQTRAYKITPERITERMAVVPRRANAAAGPTRQPPPERGRLPVMSEFFSAGEWGRASTPRTRCSTRTRRNSISKQPTGGSRSPGTSRRRTRLGGLACFAGAMCRVELAKGCEAVPNQDRPGIGLTRRTRDRELAMVDGPDDPLSTPRVEDLDLENQMRTGP
jgi:hypothetical protein